MKKLFTLICLLVLAASTSWAQQVYTEFVEKTGTLTYYYDNQMSYRSGATEEYDPVGNPYAWRFTDYYDKVLKAVIDPSMKDAPLTSTSMMFYPNGGLYFFNMTTIIGLENLNTANVTDMSKMFYRCTALTSLDLSSFNTANVTDMRGMFYECQSLTSLDLSSFNTANVTNMEEMFSRCQSLTSLNLTSFKTFKVTNMSRMFGNCPNLTTIFCNNDWSISSVLESSDRMFDLCGALVGSKGTKYDSNVIDKTYARPDGGTSKPGYFTEKSAEVYTRFDEATGTLTYYYDLNMSSRLGVTELYDPVGNPEAVRFDGYNDKVHKAVIDPSMKDAPLTSMMRMFYGNQKSSELRNMETIEGLENLNTAIVTDMSQMFYGCQSLTSLGLSSFNTANVTDMTSMFYGCNALTSLDLSSFNTANVTDMSQMFSRCQYLTSLVISSFNTANVTDMSGMFENCNDLTSLNLSSFNTANVTDMSWMFGFCASLTSLDISSFNTANVTNMNRMFTVCEKLTTIFCDDDWSTSSVLIDSEDMFDGCFVLVGGKGTKYDSNVTDKTYARPDGGTSQPGYFTEKSAEVYTEFDEATGTLTYYYDDKKASRTGVTEVYDPEDHDALRFKGYYKKVTKAVIDPSMKDAPLTSMYSMFFGGTGQDPFGIYALENMTEIDGLENLNTSTVTDMESMFFGCYALTSLDLSSFNTSAVTNMNGMFSMCQALTQLDLSSFNTSNVKDFNCMFVFCNKLKMIDVSSFDISKATDMRQMFSYCGELTTICCDKDWSSTSANSEYMFSTSRKLMGGKGTAYDSNFLDATYARPDGGTSSPGYFTAGVVGDVNGDGEVNLADAQTILGLMAKDEYKTNADVNNDSSVDLADYQTVLGIMAKQ